MIKFVTGIITKVRAPQYGEQNTNTLQAHFTNFASSNHLDVSENQTNFSGNCEIRKQSQTNLMPNVDYSTVVDNRLGERIPPQSFHFLHYHYHEPACAPQMHLHQEHL